MNASCVDETQGRVGVIGCSLELASHDTFEHPEGKAVNRRREIQRLGAAGQVKID